MRFNMHYNIEHSDLAPFVTSVLASNCISEEYNSATKEIIFSATGNEETHLHAIGLLRNLSEILSACNFHVTPDSDINDMNIVSRVRCRML